MSLDIEGLVCRYGSKEVLHGVNLSSDANLIAVVGPNAAGKSTLVKCVAGQMPFVGSITFDGTSVGRMDDTSLDLVGYMPQQHMQATSMTVYEAVLLGRITHLRWSPGSEDTGTVDHAIHELNMESMASKRLDELSGGQMQMVSIAQALVKEPRLLVMDEPTNNLDMQRQLEMFEVVKVLSKQRGLVTLVVLHDLNLAARFADEIVILREGNVYGQGSASEVFTREMLRDVYKVDADVVEDRDGRPHVVAYGSIAHAGWGVRWPGCGAVYRGSRSTRTGGTTSYSPP